MQTKQVTKDLEKHKEQAIKDVEKYKRQGIEDAKADNLGIYIADIINKANNKTNIICGDSNNRDS